MDTRQRFPSSSSAFVDLSVSPSAAYSSLAPSTGAPLGLGYASGVGDEKTGGWGLTREGSGSGQRRVSGTGGEGMPPMMRGGENGHQNGMVNGLGNQPSTLTTPQLSSRPFREARATPETYIGQRRPSLAPSPTPFPLTTPSLPTKRTPSISALPIPPLPIPSTSSLRFILLCSLWYSSSALSSNTGKVILNNFRFPVTLTIIQFFFVSSYCVLISRTGGVLSVLNTGKTRLRNPTRKIIWGTAPMAVFQVGGHIFSSLAISRVPVSTVHTIKALSPLFTVLAYAVLFRVSYSPATYLSLLPLTIGVMLACSFDMSTSNAFGLICAFGSTLVFVSSNIVFKKLMPSPGAAGAGTTGQGQGARLDKINLLFYSSGMAFVLMMPIWALTDLPALLRMWLYPLTPISTFTSATSSTPPSVPLYLFLNGTVHFAQNLLAFAILSSTSPVTYSIASLVKRIAVICLAIVWFKQSVHPIQALGIALTGLGLYMYNNAKRDVEKGEKRLRHIEAVRDGMLPLTRGDQKVLEDSRGGTPVGGMAGLGIGLSYPKEFPSPRPSFGFEGPPTSVSSAVKSPTQFALPPASYPLPSTHGQSSSNAINIPQPPHVSLSMSISDPYPSPPPSNASSPPFSYTPVPPAQMPTSSQFSGSAGSTTRRRSSSNENMKRETMSRPAAGQAKQQVLAVIESPTGSPRRSPVPHLTMEDERGREMAMAT